MEDNLSATSPRYTRVEVERMEAEGGEDGYGFPSPQYPIPKAPVWATWIVLFLAWFFLGSSVPFTVLIGLPLNVAALILAVVCLTRGGIKTGVLVLVLGTIGSVIVYLTGLLMFLTGS